MVNEQSMDEYYKAVRLRRREVINDLNGEITRIVKRLDDLENKCNEAIGHDACSGCRHTAAFKRASLDLSNLLTDFRMGRMNW